MGGLAMDRKTQLTQFVPELMSNWNNYKKGLKELKITNWCISSDYCFDDPDKLDVATFTIFPAVYINKIYNEIKENLPKDIKNKRHFTEKELNYLKNSKYFFSISIILYNLESSFNIESAIEQIEKFLKTRKEDIPFPISDKDFHDGKKKLQELFNSIKKKSCPRKKLSQIYFVAQFVAQLIEFLLIKETGKMVGWCPDKGPIDSFGNRIVYNILQSHVYRLIKNRVSDFKIVYPPSDNSDEYLYMRDELIRVPDIITGAVSSLVPMENGLTAQRTKHFEIINQYLVNNHKIINLIYDFCSNGKPITTRVYFETKDKCPLLRYFQ